jgi:signal peptidase I
MNATAGPPESGEPLRATPAIEVAHPASFLRAVVFGRRPRATLIRILLLVAITFALFRWALLPVRITGISMEPTFRDGRIKLVNRLAYRFGEPQRGDIVSIGELGKPNMLMKRIIALPGETYSMRDGQVFINGEPYPEPYVVERARWQIPKTTLGPDEYLVIGDNRSMHQQDHYFGRTERRFIVGKALF